MMAGEWSGLARRASEVRGRIPRAALWALDLATAGAAWGFGAMSLRGFFGPPALFMLPVLWAGALLVLWLTLRAVVGPLGVLRRVMGHLGDRFEEGDVGVAIGGFGALAGVALGLSPGQRRRARLSVLAVLGVPAALFITLLPPFLQALSLPAVALHLALAVAGPAADRAEEGSGGAGGAGPGNGASSLSPEFGSREQRRKE